MKSRFSCLPFSFHSCSAFGSDAAARQFSNYGGAAPKECKEEIIEDCQLGAFEFIDPASQREQPRKLDCIPGMTLDEMLKYIPGGATLNMEEKYVESIVWESNGEAMHETFGDGVTPVEAILKLYSRIKAAEREELS